MLFNRLVAGTGKDLGSGDSLHTASTVAGWRPSWLLRTRLVVVSGRVAAAPLLKLSLAQPH
jgi:hypothetical protein